MIRFPAGCTSSRTSTSLPVPTAGSESMSNLLPTAAVPETTCARWTFSVPLFQMMYAPGHGFRARMRLSRTAAGMERSNSPSTFFNIGACVARLESCGTAFKTAPQVSRQGPQQQIRPQVGELNRQASGRVIGGNRKRLLGNDAPRVKPRIHSHDRDAGLRVPIQDRSLNRSRPTPAGQERGVDIQAAMRRQIEDLGFQDLPKRRHHDKINSEGMQRLEDRGRSEFFRLHHIEPEFPGGNLDRRRLELTASPGGPVRPRNHAGDEVMAGKGPQDWDREIEASP